jgi:outer membrane protein OmpA-like peptidoglycan-associated protein
MKNIKNYKEFSVNEEEGWKDLAVGAALAAGSLMPTDAISQNVTLNKKGLDISWSDKAKTKHNVIKVKDEESSNKLQEKGYNLDSTTVDTIWNVVKEIVPPAELEVTEINYNDNQYFASGVYSISPEMADSITQTIANIISNSNDILKIQIESSTDRQGLSLRLQNDLKSKGYDPNNKGLAKARCESISNYLIDNEGIDPTLIDTIHQSEMGEGVQDASARYVVVKIVYMNKKYSRASEVVKKVPQLKTTYYLSKDTVTKKTHHIRIKFPHIKIKHHKRSVRHFKNLTKCPVF